MEHKDTTTKKQPKVSLLYLKKQTNKRYTVRFHCLFQCSSFIIWLAALKQENLTVALGLGAYLDILTLTLAPVVHQTDNP